MQRKPQPRADQTDDTAAADAEAATALRELDGATYENTPAFGMRGRRELARCVRVYDGDTCWLAVRIAAGLVRRFRCRVAGYDAPELRTRDAAEKEAAARCKAALERLVLGRVVYAEFDAKRDDKYGRLLATLYVRRAPHAAGDRGADADAPTADVHEVPRDAASDPALIDVGRHMLRHTGGDCVPYDGGHKTPYAERSVAATTTTTATAAAMSKQ